MFSLVVVSWVVVVIFGVVAVSRVLVESIVGLVVGSIIGLVVELIAGLFCPDYERYV